MRNRAKCKLCNEVIESVALSDMQFCSCGEIGVEGGTTLYRTYAKNFSNFLRVHDDGKEVEVTVKKKEEPMSPLSKEEKLKELESFIERLEGLNSDALSASATNYDVLTICYFIKLLATD